MADEERELHFNETRGGIPLRSGRSTSVRVAGLSLATDPVFKHVSGLRTFLRIDNDGTKRYDMAAFQTEVSRMLGILQSPVALDAWCRERGIRRSVYDPRLAAQWDSSYKGLYQELHTLSQAGTVPGSAPNDKYMFESTMMHPMEVNYYFIGMLFKQMGSPESGMMTLIYAWKGLSYFGSPSANDVAMAQRGFAETSGGTVEVAAHQETDPTRMATRIINEIEGSEGVIVDRDEEQAMLRLLERAAQAGTLDTVLNYLLSRGRLREAFNEISDNFKNTLRMVVTGYSSSIFHEYLPS